MQLLKKSSSKKRLNCQSYQVMAWAVTEHKPGTQSLCGYWKSCFLIDEGVTGCKLGRSPLENPRCFTFDSSFPRKKMAMRKSVCVSECWVLILELFKWNQKTLWDTHSEEKLVFEESFLTGFKLGEIRTTTFSIS